MSAIVSPAGLASSFRPRRFVDVVGQRHVVALLKAQLTSGRVERQILLAGPTGLGKTTLARIFAAALNCSARAEDGDCCLECESCRMITASAHPDVVEIDAASNGGKDEINAIAHAAQLAPMLARWKVYIVDEAHGITRAGAEAFLKLLEEPPPHVVFILATTDAHKMLATIRGRCQMFELALPTGRELAANLRRVAAGNGWELSDEVVTLVLKASPASLGVRGTVVTLSKVSPLLSAGVTDAKVIADALGVMSDDDVAGLLAACGCGDVSAALAALDVLRGRFSDAMIRSSVVEALVAPFRAGAGDLEALRIATAASPTADDVTLAVVRLAARHTQRAASPPQPADQITSRSPDAAASPELPPQDLTAPAPSRRNVTAKERPSSPSRRPQPKPVPSVAPTPVEGDDPWFSNPDAYTVASDDPLAPFWAALTSNRPRAHDLLASCDVSMQGGHLRVIVPPELIERAGNERFRAAVEEVAASTVAVPVRWFRRQLGS